MPRKKKQEIRVNDSESLENLMQETYNDACSQLLDAQRTINEMSNATDPEDVSDYSLIAKEKTNALKIKDSAIKIKLEIAKLQSDILKHSGDLNKAISDNSSGSATLDDFDTVRAMITKANKKEDNEYQLD